MKRALVLLVMAFLGAIAGGCLYLFALRPNTRAATGLHIEATPERLARGEYLVNNVVVCFACHTEKDTSKRAHPKIGPEGAGGECFTEEMGFPGHVCAPNITPDAETGIGAWSDDEVLRAIREGVDNHGEVLFPMMPYTTYRSLPDEDAYAIVAYIRSIPAQRNAMAPNTVNFPVSMFIRMAPQPVTEPVGPVAQDDLVQYGEHMVTISGCKLCHLDDLAGGEEFPMPQGVVRSANLTPGAKGIVPDNADDFIRIFHAYQGGELPQGVTDKDHTVMPWSVYSGMADDDLRAIHAYLRSLPPVEKQIQTYGESKAD
ncbi:MAG: c-type cytochrome [Acidobacteria bacterium]|nr:c-type cytochrome [Acidobacteriota bacterium]